MGNVRRGSGRSNSIVAARGSSGRSWGMKLFAAGVLGFALLGLSACRKAESGNAPTAAPVAAQAAGVAAAPAAPAAAVAPAAPAAPTIALDKVKGSWVRQDGGYRLVIGEIGAEGHTKGEYFNPSPIKVAWTRVRAEGGVIKVDVELRDTNYPGCLYKLTYDAAGDRLVGTYFQAQMQETYEIEFARQP